MNQNSIHKEYQSTLHSGNACCHSVQNILSSSFLSKTIKIRVQRTVILSVVLYGYENWSVILEKEYMLRRIFGPKRDEVTGEWEKLHNEELSDLYCSRNIVGVKKLRRRDGRGM